MTRTSNSDVTRRSKRWFFALACSLVAAGCATTAPRPELVSVENVDGGRFVLHGPDEASVQAKSASVCPGSYRVTRFFHGSNAQLRPRKRLSETRFASLDYQTLVQHEIVCNGRS